MNMIVFLGVMASVWSELDRGQHRDSSVNVSARSHANSQMSVMVDVIPMLQRFILRLIQIIAGQILSFIYKGQSERIPTPKSSILMLSANTLADRIRDGKFSSYEVVKTFADRINEINDTLNCVVDTRFEEALEEARKVDEFIASGVKTKEEILADTPFLGVPFTTKDSVAVSGMVNAAGVLARKDVRAEKDSQVVSLMRKAGGIPLAITNVSELCFWWECNNPVFGKTKNPYNTNRTPGGSSGGEACLISSCGSPMGIGSDIGGSVRIPAAFNGIFGHKPSANATPLEGLWPKVGQPQSYYNTVGPMSRFSEDLLPILKVMTSLSTLDLKLSEPVNIKSLKYFYMEDDGGGNLTSPVQPEIKMAVRRIVEHFKRVHGINAQKLHLNALKHSKDIWMTKITDGQGVQISSQLSNNEGKINVCKEMLRAVTRFSGHTMATLLMAYMEETAAPAESLQRKIYENLYCQLETELQELLGTDGVLIYPTQPRTASYHYETLVRPFDFAYTGIFNILGLPSTQCPMGMDSEGLPIGIQVIGGKNQDRLTLAVARELEEAFGGWRPSPTKGILTLKNRMLIESES